MPPNINIQKKWTMKNEKMNLIDACDRAVDIISQADTIERLYHRGIQCFGEGKLRNGVMNLAAEAIQDEKLSREVFASDESMVSFLCGVWVQFLLVEVAGVKKGELKSLAQKAFSETLEKKSIH